MSVIPRGAITTFNNNFYAHFKSILKTETKIKFSSLINPSAAALSSFSSTAMVAFLTFLFSSAPSSVGNPQLRCNNDNPQERIEYPQYKTKKITRGMWNRQKRTMILTVRFIS